MARLAILGVASRMRFSYDEVEDIRLAVGEACTSVIDRVNGLDDSAPPIAIRCSISASRLVVEVIDQLRDQGAAAEPADLPPDNPEKGLGSVLIRILMDEVDSAEDEAAGTHTIRMIKNVAR